MPVAPQEVCPLTLKTPPLKPGRKRNVILWLSTDADVIIVDFGIVQRYCETSLCVELVSGMTTLNVFESPIHAENKPLTEFIAEGVGGKLITDRVL